MTVKSESDVGLLSLFLASDRAILAMLMGLSGDVLAIEGWGVVNRTPNLTGADSRVGVTEGK